MLNCLNADLLGKPSLRSERCVVCGAKATNNHHVIAKGMGGSKQARLIPTVSLCGMGNTSGCHGKAHSGQLHFDYRDGYGWMYCETEPCSYQDALDNGEWWPCRSW